MDHFFKYIVFVPFKGAYPPVEIIHVQEIFEANILAQNFLQFPLLKGLHVTLKGDILYLLWMRRKQPSRDVQPK